jgi:hypothetical protein
VSLALDYQPARPTQTASVGYVLLSNTRSYPTVDCNRFPGPYHGSGETLEEEVARYVTYFQLPFYQHVTINDEPSRPLVYLLGSDGHSLEGLTALRTACRNANIAEPYVVLMGGGGVAKLQKEVETLAAQALSSYVLIGVRPAA